MAIKTLKDLQRLHKSYEYIELIQFSVKYTIIRYNCCTGRSYGEISMKKLVDHWRKVFEISRKEYIVLIVDENVYDKLQCYTHSYVYTVQELFRKEKVIVDKIQDEPFTS